MKTKHFLFAALLLGILTACSLNGQQESSLNSAKMAYVDAFNQNNTTMLVKLTYADAVRFYQKQGDSVFKERFRPENNPTYIQNGSMKTVESQGDVIHVEFEFEEITDDGYEPKMNPTTIYAISMDDGSHWKFLSSIEYNNPEIMTSKKKLIKK